jgi:hypothetical protein
MCEAGSEFETPTEGGEEFEALVDRICAEAREPPPSAEAAAEAAAPTDPCAPPAAPLAALEMSLKRAPIVDREPRKRREARVLSPRGKGRHGSGRLWQ